MKKTIATIIIMHMLFISGTLWAGDSSDADTSGDLFISGIGGYDTYRIPAMVVTKIGTVLAICEGRKTGRSDTGNIDILLRRSTDGGVSWGKTQIIWDDKNNVCGNPCPVVDQKTGIIWLLMTHNLGIDHESQIIKGTSQGSRTIWLSKSINDGKSWSKPIEITSTTKKPDWTWYATGPGAGIQIAHGKHQQNSSEGHNLQSGLLSDGRLTKAKGKGKK